MSQLEEVLVKGVTVVWKDYEHVSGGWWLSHAPESFLQCRIASYVSHKLCTNVFPECSPKRWKDSLTEDVVKRGRPPKVNDKQRFDLIVWWKNNRPGAIVEIKRAYSAAGVLADAQKVWGYRKEAVRYGFTTAYLLVYTEACRNGGWGRGKETINQRLTDWRNSIRKQIKKEVGLFRVGPKEPRGQISPSDTERRIWSWGCGVYKIDLR